jgi:muconolactone delta-isomerase
MAEGLIVGGGAVVGRVALRFVFEVESSEHLDRLVSTLPMWPVAETRVTPLITVDERRQHVQTLLSTLTTR